MKLMVLIGATLALSSSALSAESWLGQAPQAPYLAYLQALPDCGLAATDDWGRNGFQPCDPRNVYPRANQFERRRGYRDN